MATREEHDQAACHHRYKLVGYRTRNYDPNSSAVQDAVLACMRCAVEKLFPVTTIPPAPIIETGRR